MMPRLIALLVIVATIVWLLQRRRVGAQGSESANARRDRDLFDELQQHFEQVEGAREQARYWSDGEVRLAVEHYLFKIAHSDDDGGLGMQLAQQPERTGEHVRRVLRSPDMQTRLQKRHRGETPWVRACRLLDHGPAAQNAPFVRERIDDPEEPVRRQAWHWLARIGSDEVIPDLVRGIADPQDASTRGWILIGLASADGEARISRRGQEALFEPLLDHLDGYDTREAPAMLLGWDRERALEAFERRGLLEPDHAEFGYVVQAMAGAGLSLPRHQLLALLERGSEPFTTSTFRAFGTMLGNHRDPQDEAVLLRWMGATGDLAEAAAAGMLAHCGIDDWHDRLQARRPRWSETERRIDAMRSVENEVCNGGFAQYWFLSAGAGWQDAVAGFTEVRDEHRAGLIGAAAARFSTPPAAERDQRMEQLTQLGDDAFGDLDGRYLEPRADIDVVLTRYMLAHLPELREAWGLRTPA